MIIINGKDYILLNMVFTIGITILFVTLVVMNVEILKTFSVLYDSTLTAKTINNFRAVFLSILLFALAPWSYYSTRLNDVERSSNLLGLGSGATCAIYDNIQSIYILTKLFQLKKSSGKGTHEQILIHLQILSIAIEVFGIGAGIFALFTTDIDLYGTLNLVPAPVVVIFGVIKAVVFDQLKKLVALKKKIAAPVKKIVETGTVMITNPGSIVTDIPKTDIVSKS
jgi:hypothetical protein